MIIQITVFSLYWGQISTFPFVLYSSCFSYRWLSSHWLAHNLINSFLSLFIKPYFCIWFISIVFSPTQKLSSDYWSLRALVHLIVILTIWIPYCSWVMPLIHTYINTKTILLEVTKHLWSTTTKSFLEW